MHIHTSIYSGLLLLCGHILKVGIVEKSLPEMNICLLISLTPYSILVMPFIKLIKCFLSGDILPNIEMFRLIRFRQSPS